MTPAWLSILEEVHQKLEEIRCTRSGAFFRGHTDANHKLIPSLMRQRTAPDTEHNLYSECFVRGGPLLASSASPWEVLSLMQHYGIPTRLLDWTDSFAVAVFFAILGQPPNPRVWLLNAFRLNVETKASKVAKLFTIGIDEFPDYARSFVQLDKPEPWPFKKATFIVVPWINERIRAQKGYFTFHTDETPLEEQCPKWIRSVNIPEEASSGARRFLELAGVNEHTVFPDFVGLARFLRRKYNT